MSDDLKIAINDLQNRIAKDSDSILLIFENKEDLKLFLENNKDVDFNYVVRTIEDICYTRSLLGIDYSYYCFITNKLFEEMKRKWENM